MLCIFVCYALIPYDHSNLRTRDKQIAMFLSCSLQDM
jgi:hypothetical protein